MTKPQTLKSRIEKMKDVDWKSLSWLQNDLKDLSKKDFERMKESMRRNMFIMPFHVWRDEKTCWILDGHHRQKALEELMKEGWSIPKQLPAVFVACTSKEDALKLVLIYSSAYARVTVEGLYAHSLEAKLDLTQLKDEIAPPGIDVTLFAEGFTPEKDLPKEERAKCICQTCGNSHNL